MSDDDLIRRGDAIAAAANLYKWSVAAGEELEAAIRAIPAADRIEQLVATNEALVKEVQRWHDLFDEKHNLMLEQQTRAERLEAVLREIANGKPIFAYVQSGPNGADFDAPGSPFDRGKAEGYAELQAIARAALTDGAADE